MVTVELELSMFGILQIADEFWLTRNSGCQGPVNSTMIEVATMNAVF